MPDSFPPDVFDTGHYAATGAEKARRAAQLAGRYYLSALPRYLKARRQAGLGWDGEALTLPLREFRRQAHHDFPLPPGYGEALTALHEAGVRVTMPRLRLEALLGAWWTTRDVAGHDIECGAYRGATGLALAVLSAHYGLDRRVLLLDTFAGSPAGGEHDALRGGGDYAPEAGWTDILAAQAEALGVRDRVEIHQGLFADTFARLDDVVRFAFAHVDANVYEGTRDACRFTLPRLNSGGLAVFDDYHGVLDLGARLAIDECLEGRRPQALAWTSAYVRA